MARAGLMGLVNVYDARQSVVSRPVQKLMRPRTCTVHGSQMGVARKLRRFVPAALLILWSAGFGCDSPDSESGVAASNAHYEQRESARPQGTGRIYMGREIAEITGVGRQEWLERPERETEELPNRVVRALELRPDDSVADIGAGTGYFTFRISPHVPDGKVFAVDIEKEMLAMIRSRADERGVTNVVPVLGTETDPNLPDDSLDVALIVFTYTQFTYPREMMENLRRALVPGGRVVLVEYRGEDPTIPVSPLYTLTEDQAKQELTAAGLRWRETRDILPQHHFMVFEKPLQ